MENWSLSPHFTYYEMTSTSNDELREKNRIEGKRFLTPLIEVCSLLEEIRTALYKPLYIHSGFRCPELNGAIAGSSNRSQHMKGEAVDFTALGESSKDQVNKLFDDVLDYLVKAKVSFGQIINESADRGYGDRANWIHLSLGVPYRPKESCKQVLRMENGKYELLKQL